MQSIIFPMTNMRITTGVNELSHKGSNAIDIAGKDIGIENVFAPFTGTIKRIYKNGNTVWLESNEKVLYADGTVDYATASFTHDNAVNDLRVRQVINQSQVFYQEGTNNAVGNHVHLEIGRGKFTGTGWYQNSYGNWVINNSIEPWKAFWLKDVNIIDGHNYPWNIYKKEDKVMISETALGVLYRFYLGIPTTEYGKKTYLGKKTFEDTEIAIYSSQEYKDLIKNFALTQTGAISHLPIKMREVVKLPEQVK